MSPCIVVWALIFFAPEMFHIAFKFYETDNHKQQVYPRSKLKFLLSRYNLSLIKQLTYQLLTCLFNRYRTTILSMTSMVVICRCTIGICGRRIVIWPLRVIIFVILMWLGITLILVVFWNFFCLRIMKKYIVSEIIGQRTMEIFIVRTSGLVYLDSR